MHARLRGPKSLLTLIEPDVPSLTDEIAEQRPDMNSKVAAFTVNEKSINNNATHEKINKLLDYFFKRI